MPPSTQSTVVLVHGAFADASGFGGVIRELSASGYRVLAPPNPLRGLVGDAAAVSAVAGAIDGPVVLVGHSYGGAFQFIETGIFAALAAALIAVTFFVVRRRDA